MQNRVNPHLSESQYKFSDKTSIREIDEILQAERIIQRVKKITGNI